MCKYKMLIIMVAVIGIMAILSAETVSAAGGTIDVTAGDETTVSNTDSSIGISPVAFFFAVLGVCILIGVLAVLGGVGGGVIFTPLFMGFTPIDSLVIRATGLFVAMCGSLIAARPFLIKGLANIRVIFFAAVPYSTCAIIGALMAGWIDQSMGETGDAIIKLLLGILVVSVGGLIIFGGSKTEYPEACNVDGFTARMGLSMSCWEQSLGRVVHYEVNRAPIGLVLFCFVGLISGLFGLGAGWAMVPTFNMAMLMPLKAAAATSKVLIGVGDTAAVWPYLNHGAILPLLAVPAMIGLVLGTIIGSKILIRIKAGPIRYLIILVMFFSGGKLIFDGITNL